jgi:hypothetical protein
LGLFEDEKGHNDRLDIVTAMAHQELAEGARLVPYCGDYFAILNQLDIRKIVSHFCLCPACSLRYVRISAIDLAPYPKHSGANRFRAPTIDGETGPSFDGVRVYIHHSLLFDDWLRFRGI